MRPSHLLLVVLLFLGCGHKEEAVSQRKSQFEAKASEMASKYDADESWVKSLAKCDSLGLPITTLHLQQTFPETTAHPFLFYARLDDLYKQDDKHFAAFVIPAFTYSMFGVSMYLELACTGEQAQELLKVKRDRWWFADVAIVARVDGVRKLRFSFEAVPDCYEGYEEAYIEIKPSRVFLVKGELLDFCEPS